MTNLPPLFLDTMQDILGGEYPAFLDSYQERRRYGLRVNTAKISPEEFERIAPFHLTPIPWISGGYYYQEEDRAARHPFYHAGLYYLQEPTAMTPACILDIREGDRVLDLCAAPGGKATALAAKLHGSGLLVANDISASRAKALLKNLEVFGVRNAFVTNAVPARLEPVFHGYFDRVLLDAPCSGEGMFRKDEDTVRAWDPQKPAACARIQKELIGLAACMLRPGGRMLYSTCTFSPLENEEVVLDLLKNNPGMRLIPIPETEGFSPGLTRIDGRMKDCVRLWPHRIGGEGHFMALLEKTVSDGTPAVSEEPVHPGKEKRKKGKSRQEKKTETSDPGQTAARFLDEAGFSCRAELLDIRQDQVYLPAVSCEQAKGIPFLRNGLYMGTIRKDRFEPSQSLAMAFSPEEAKESPCRLSFSQDDPRLERYLRGETISVEPDEAQIGRAHV